MSNDENLGVKKDLPDDAMTEEQPRQEPSTSATTTNSSTITTTNTTTANTTGTTTTTTAVASTSTTTTSRNSSVSIAVGTEDLHSDDSSLPDGDTQAAQPSTSRMSPDSEAAQATKNLRTCRVCGDRAKSMHFGGLSCDSCKAFFRRAVHNDAYVNFTCPYDGNCVINIASRKCCQYCRYKKCTSIGMERSWVMSEEDRAHMMKQRAEKKAKMDDDNNRRGFKEGKRELVPHEPDQATMLDHMTAEERDEIERAVLRYRRAYNDVPYRHELKNCNVDRPSIQIINMFTTIVRRFAYFARLFPEFCDLPPQDQGNLLRGGILEMSLIRGVQSFDSEHNRWPDTNHHLYTDAPTLRVEDMKKLVSCELYEMHMKFIHSLKELNVDEPVMMLLLLIVLFTSDRPELAAAATVQQRQDHYLHLLRKYLGWRYGPHNAPILYPRLLIKLTDLRELNDQHTEYNLKLAKQEIAEIQMQLGRLDLNPYTEWPTILQHQNGSSSPPAAPPQEVPGPSTAPGRVGSPSESPVQVTVTPATPTPGEGIQANLSGMLRAGGDLPGPFSSGIGGLLALLDFEQLASNPSFQRVIMQQFQKSIMNVLSSPNFGLGNLFPDGRTLQQQQQQQQQQQPVPTNSQQDPSSIPQQPPQTQAPPPQFLLQQQKPQQQPQGPAGQVPIPPQGVPQGYPASDLMTQLDYLDSNHPSSLQNVQQSQQAFQQLEHQLMSNISDYSNFGEQNHHHQLLQQQYHYQLQQQHQQQLQQQALFHHHQQQMHHPQLQEEEEPMHQQHMAGPPLVIPKEEPMTPSPPNMHAPHTQVEHPLLFDEPHCMMHEPHRQHSPPHQSSPTLPRQQTSPKDDDPRPRRNSLTDFSGLTQFRNMLEEFATLNNPDHLQQVKQILGPDLVASLQQKLVSSEASLQAHHHHHHQQQQQQPLPLQQTPSPPSQPPHFPSQSHVYSPTTSYQFFSGREYQRQVAGGEVSSSSYSPDTQGPSTSLQYGPADTSSFCRSQHRVTPPALGVATIISPPPAAPFPITDTPPVVYQYPPPDLVHNVTSAT